MAKRATSGSIYRPVYTYQGKCVPSQVWWIKYYVDGKPIRESTKTTSWEEANRTLKRKQGEVATGQYGGPFIERVTLKALLKAVEDDYLENERNTLLDVQLRNKNHLIPALGHLRASQCGSEQFKRYIRTRKKEGAANGTINRELAIVSRAYRLGAQQDPPRVLRVPYIPKLPEDNVREGFLEHAQYLKLREALPNRLKALLVCGYYWGVRSGELRKIRADQVDLTANCIYVSRRTTKNKDAHTLPIYGELRDWIELQLKDRAQRFPNCPWLFFDDKGRRIHQFQKAWATACAAAGVPHLLFHDLRRSAAMNMDRAGVPRKVAMQITGHKTEAMYMRYRIVPAKDLDEAGQRMQSYMESMQAKTPDSDGQENQQKGAAKPE